MRSLCRLVGVAVLAAAPVAGLALALAPTAAAHDELVSSSPEDGATVTEPITEIELVFSNAIPAEFVQVSVLDAAEATHHDGTPEVAGDTVTQPVRPLVDGAYTIAYRVVSSDGHPISGTVEFTVSGVGADEPAQTPTEPVPPPSAPPPAESPPAESPPGPATGSPDATSEPDADTTPAAATDDGGGLGTTATVLLVVGGAVVVAVLAFVAAGGRRRDAAEDTES